MNVLKFYVMGRKTMFSFLFLLVLPIFSEGKGRDEGYFRIYREEGKVIWELSESLVGREWLLVNQLVAVGTRYSAQAGDMSGDPQILQLRKKEDGQIALMCKAVMSKNAGSNMTGVPKAPYEVASFPVGKSVDGRGICLDITSWVVSDTGMVKGKLRMPTLKTVSHEDCLEVIGWRERKEGFVQTSSCLLLMSEDLMRLRYEDERVGYFRSKHLVCGDTMAKEDEFYCVSRWRLEPRPEDMKKYRKGELVEPREPILFYIDPLTPAKWVPFIETAINNWNPAFEQAGFKNAIRARVAPSDDSTWTLESCRAAIVYRPNTEENAFGERYADPRSGQIYHARIMWGHSLVEWLKGNYMLQAGPCDPSVFAEGFSDEWLGTLLAVIVSHEVGHTLGLTHNFGASSAIPTEKLRDNDWLTEHGISASIMDYSRFNYVAQPGDHIGRLNLIPRINVYDRWAIEWGYRLFPELKTLEEEHAHVSAWTAEQQRNWGYWFGSEKGTNDPRAQSEDLGDDLVTANTYGVENLKRVLAEMDRWAPDADGSYTTYRKMFDRIIMLGDRNVPMGQFHHYLRQVVNIVGGSNLDYDEKGQPVKTCVDSIYQYRAMRFLEEHIFTTPEWLLAPMFAGKADHEPIQFLGALQAGVMALLIPKASALPARDTVGVYKMDDFFRDLTRIVWGDVLAGEMPDVYRQNLQRIFLQRINAYGMSGGPQVIKLYKGYVAGLKEEVEQALAKNQKEDFGIYCRDMVRVMNKYLK